MLLLQIVQLSDFLIQRGFQSLNFRYQQLVFPFKILNFVFEVFILSLETLKHLFILGDQFATEIGHVLLHFTLPIVLTFEGLGF